MSDETHGEVVGSASFSFERGLRIENQLLTGEQTVLVLKSIMAGVTTVDATADVLATVAGVWVRKAVESFLLDLTDKFMASEQYARAVRDGE